MTDLAACLLGAAWLIAGAATWLWHVEPWLRVLDRYDWLALAGYLLLWPVALLYTQAWRSGYGAGKAGR